MREYHSVKKEAYLKEVLRLRFTLDYSVRKISTILPLTKSTIHRWIANFAPSNYKPLITMKSKLPAKTMRELSQEGTPEALRKRIKELESQLDDAEFRAEAYKTMIEVAESMGMPVRKKAGAKR